MKVKPDDEGRRLAAREHSSREPEQPQAGRARDSLAAAAAPFAQLWAAGQHAWEAPRSRIWRGEISALRARPESGTIALLAGIALVSVLVAAINRVIVPLPNPGIVYLPLLAMLAYHWNWRYAAVGCVLQLGCVYILFILPPGMSKSLTRGAVEQLVTLVLVDAFILALVQLARARRDLAEREAARFAALNTVGTALAGELDEQRLLRLIAETARDLTGASFAAFTLRPVDPLGHPIGPAEGSRFHLAAVVGVTPEQEALFRRMPLGGEGLLAPIFRHGTSVRVPDALKFLVGASSTSGSAQGDEHDSTDVNATRDTPRALARQRAFAYARGQLTSADLSGVGVPRGHPVVRSFLGAPLLDRDGQVQGGLLLGHSQPGRFTQDDEALLVALAAQAAVVMDNARLYRAARTQARELDTLFESIADAVSVVDAQGHVRQENRAAASIRTSPATSAGDTTGASDSASSAVPPVIGEAVSRALAGQQVSNVLVTRAEANGRRRDYLVSASPLLPDQTTRAGSAVQSHPDGPARTVGTVEDAAGSGAVVVWHDVTETRELLAEQQARSHAEAQRTLLQMVIDELPSGVYLVGGRDARLVLANRAAMEVWGAEWPVGKGMADFLAESGTQITGMGGQPLTDAELATLLAVRTGEAVRHHQEIIRRPDGTSMPVLLNAVALDPTILSGLEPTGRAGEPTDAEMTSAGAGLGTAALIVLQDVTALKDAERLKDEFITIAAHELKTPMAAVKGYADMLLRQSTLDAQERLADWQTEALETIDQATQRLVELTNDLLDVTRIQAGRMELHVEPHDLAALVRRVVRRFQVTTDHHTLSLEVESAEGYVVACMDVSRTEQVVGNLLSNAIKYSPEGGTISLSIREQPDQGQAELCVRDQGIGIPVAQQARLFNRFSRADNARELGIAGTGLGLYLCRELVELQRGRIWFTSAEGQGTTFHVTLPLATD